MSLLPDARQFAPATQRNQEPILTVLLEVLPPTGTILEISSGTGEHAVFFAPRLQPRQWLPSDPNAEARASIAAWQSDRPAKNLHPPIALDVREPIWLVEQFPELPGLDLQRDPVQAIVNINMIHIAPWSACLGLIAGARRILPASGILYLYGPFKREGQHTAPSNEAFDTSLKQRNPEWGVRNLEDVVAIAQAQGFSLAKICEMPANNLSVVFRKQ
ncbi:MAG: DUF938 domain-containing protein [Drouetiella hepatica Uher 2000/2452]|jgi:hypothetical protein|uniref:DUF938 domain-containing protein n=1 Tax=Drouetiella hepatica Uher 2000/2452 TaxID=904376 RepID=A0A951UPC8_9CYAN|nr:DUF938 domain-containing protein [Drouetiella hepatica Uher 2000/2452]